MLLALVLSLAAAQTPEPQRVAVGMHLRNVEAVNLEENSYHASFVLWAAWTGERDASKSLRFVNLLEAWALTLQPVYDEPLTLPDGRRYQRFTGEGRFFHKFELGSFPLDTQDVVLELEDVQRTDAELVLEIDPSSSVTPDLKVPGWFVGKEVEQAVKVSYPTGFGMGEKDTRTRLRFGATIERPRRVFFITMFPPILLVMLCCWFIFFLRPIHVEARVGTVITALLTTVFLQLAFTDDLPYLGTTVLLDQIFNFSYVVITLVLLECVLVMRWHDHAQALEASLSGMPEAERTGIDAERRRARDRAELIDRRSKWIFPLGYALGCLGILVVAGPATPRW